ncbi:MAG: hypothetical protein F6K50_13605 [Moorea sp. SIO3I7]|uniref:hypothetical protein n=2 Tax=Coleofasciculaceae TaxID=1892251 RepID=UPI0013C9C7C7|nr:hypothetical protein [Moorena sp. SIO4A1]NEN96530.1 hypothetical protein [Moorena sp. SIO3I7]NEQ60800.1 hypothetical protein [Moorena sp. SIO4A1]
MVEWASCPFHGGMGILPVSWWNGHLARFMVEWASCPFHGGMGILPVSWWNGHLARFNCLNSSKNSNQTGGYPHSRFLEESGTINSSYRVLSHCLVHQSRRVPQSGL